MENSGVKSQENLAVRTHRRVVMGRRVHQISSHIASLIPKEVVSVLDVGAGSGEMAQAIGRLRPGLEISGVDVYVRAKTFVPVVKYDGIHLPYEDKSMDVVMTVDVLHHCADPVAVLKECARVSRRWVIVKDHVANGLIDRVTLRFMDWVGNRAHGVVLPYNYLSSSDWVDAFKSVGLVSSQQVDGLRLYPLPFDLVFGGSLHCLHLLRNA